MKTKFKNGVYMRRSGTFLLLKNCGPTIIRFKKGRKLIGENSIIFHTSEWFLERKLKDCEYLGEL